MLDIKAVHAGEPIYFICDDANTYYQVELIGGILVVHSGNFAYGPCESSIEPLSRSAVSVKAKIHRHTEVQPSGRIMDHGFTDPPTGA